MPERYEHEQHAHPGPADPAPAPDLDAIGDRAAWVASTGFVVGDNARRLVAEDVPGLLALARRLLAENAGLRVQVGLRDALLDQAQDWERRLRAGRARTAARLRRERGLRRAAVDLLVEQCDARDAARAVLRPLLADPWITCHDPDGGAVALCGVCGQEDEGGHADGCPVLDKARLLGDEAGTG